ncbi:hypothetical protein DL546_003006 [Coniochaeta pulveracea]|uniref:Uncharacterized protein n=1 Tax=Coniochaeta pulveracea TaxID=177199 RepID=A0A420Y228_9PEZI|nr:hypothetical protein DL546_003006 [Coniochaeta pulveracea]RKU41934.1 hypothetical protein DL546_003006 [Coniochaeta pulveracea]
MVSAKTNGALLLQAVLCYSSVAARCRAPPACWADDSLNALLRAEDGAAPFCSDFLGLPASTVSATVTPTVFATVTETSHATQTTTTFDETITVTVPYEALQKRDADVAYPSWLPTTYSVSRVSSACSCLNPSLSLTTATTTAEAATITASLTVTETSTTTAEDIAIVTVTAAPLPVTYRAVIEVLRKDTGATQGYIYNSNGPAVTDQVARAATVNFSIPGGATYAETVQINVEGLTQVLGFQGTSYSDRVLALY